MLIAMIRKNSQLLSIVHYVIEWTLYVACVCVDFSLNRPFNVSPFSCCVLLVLIDAIQYASPAPANNHFRIYLSAINSKSYYSTELTGRAVYKYVLLLFLTLFYYWYTFHWENHLYSYCVFYSRYQYHLIFSLNRLCVCVFIYWKKCLSFSLFFRAYIESGEKAIKVFTVSSKCLDGLSVDFLHIFILMNSFFIVVYHIGYEAKVLEFFISLCLLCLFLSSC